MAVTSSSSSAKRSPSLVSSSSSGFASSTASRFSAGSATFFPGSAYGQPSPSSSTLRFANRPGSPGRSISVTANQFAGNKKSNNHNGTNTKNKKTCLCSPTTHPGSFRCALHKNSPRGGAAPSSNGGGTSSYHSSIRLNYRRSAMKNSLVRIGGVEGDLVRRALSALIRPSSHSQRRRVDFQPKPSRLSIMSKASEDGVC